MPHDELPIFVLWESVLGEILDRTVRFPKAVRFTFGQRIDHLALDVLQALVRARYARPKGEPLREASLSLEQLRVLCRVAHDRAYLDHGAFEHLARRLDEAGRMLGGWLRWDGGVRRPDEVAEHDFECDSMGDPLPSGPEPTR